MFFKKVPLKSLYATSYKRKACHQLQNFFNMVDYKECITFCRIIMNEEKYCHALVSSELRARGFYRKLLAEGKSWEEIFYMVKTGESQRIAPRLQWNVICPKLEKLDVEKHFEILQPRGVKLLLGDSLPEGLRNTSDAPVFLYARGNIEVLFHKTIGLVGARSMSSHAKEVLHSIVPRCVELGLSIVSGLAQGVDVMAHEICLKYGGTAIAVLGCGVTECYPMANQKCYDKILERGGCIVSEYPPERNRIIAGLSQALCVVQASLKSGSLITASEALEQGKNIYVVPGLFGDERFAGSNRLIRDGAYILSDVESFNQYFDGLPSPPTAMVFQSVEEEVVWKLLADPKTLDDLMGTSGVSFSVLGQMLFRWEIDGKVVQEGGRYRKI